MNPIISVIVPVFNVEEYLHFCLDSILAQTFRDFELILINDGSTDRSGTICEQYSRKDKRIKVIHKNNAGVSAARNSGLKIATGEYIAFVDSDDFIHQRMLEILYGYASKYSSDLVLCDYTETFFGGQYDLEDSIDIHIMEENYNNIEALNQLYSDKKMQFGCIICNKLYKKSLFNNLEFAEGKIHEDEFLSHRILFKCSMVTYLPIKLYFYLQRSSGIMGSEFSIKRLDAVDAYRERVEFFKRANLTDLQKKAEYNYVNLLFKYYFKTKELIPNSDRKLTSLKRGFRKNLKSLNKNPYYSKKEKMLWLLFVLNTTLYELYLKIKKEANESVSP
jgi:glycosyltransferase involved in cell wall biosynthesis